MAHRMSIFPAPIPVRQKSAPFCTRVFVVVVIVGLLVVEGWISSYEGEFFGYCFLSLGGGVTSRTSEVLVFFFP